MKGRECLEVVVVSPTRCEMDLPAAVCDKGQHTGNPHCPVVETPDVSAVPLPSAVWLLASALVALIVVKRRK